MPRGVPWRAKVVIVISLLVSAFAYRLDPSGCVVVTSYRGRNPVPPPLLVQEHR